MNLLVGTDESIIVEVQKSFSIGARATPSIASVTIQNLGNGNLYIDSQPAVSITTGMVLPAGATYTYQTSGPLFVIADQPNTDVRYF